jgi:hypothetical protein
MNDQRDMIELRELSVLIDLTAIVLKEARDKIAATEYTTSTSRTGTKRSLVETQEITAEMIAGRASSEGVIESNLSSPVF